MKLFRNVRRKFRSIVSKLSTDRALLQTFDNKLYYQPEVVQVYANSSTVLCGPRFLYGRRVRVLNI